METTSGMRRQPWRPYCGDRRTIGILRAKLQLAPDVRPWSRLDGQHNLAVLEDAHRAGRLADNDGDGPRDLADGSGGGMTSPQSHRQGNLMMRRLDVHAGGHRDTVAADDQCPF